MILFDQVQQSIQYLRSCTDFVADTALVLGTGLGALADPLETVVAIPYEDIPHFPAATVESHAGKLIFGRLYGVPVVVMSGRFHYYEGYSMQQVTFPVRVLKALGVARLLMSNAVGSVNATMRPGDLVFVSDHINLQPENPLRGPNDERLGLRFPDMLYAYDPQLIEKAMACTATHGIRAHRGVYAGLQGPNLETPAEYRFLHRIGADVVGMSTVPEVLVARHSAMQVFVVSVVSNACFPIENIRKTTLEQVIAVVRDAEPAVSTVLKALLG